MSEVHGESPKGDSLVNTNINTTTAATAATATAASAYKFEEAYDTFLTKIRSYLLDASPEIITSAVEILLEILGSDTINVTTKRKEINALLKIQVKDEELSQLIQLANLHNSFLHKHEIDQAGEKHHHQQQQQQQQQQIVTVDIEMDEEEDGNQLEGGEVYSKEVVELEDEEDEQVNDQKEDYDDSIERGVASQVAFNWQIFKSRMARIGIEIETVSKILSDKTIDASKVLKEKLKHLIEDSALVDKIVEDRWRIVFTKRLEENETTLSLKKIMKEMFSLRLYNLAMELIFTEKDQRHITQELTRRRFYEEKATELKVTLPEGTFQEKLPSYDIITVPPPLAKQKNVEKDELLPTSSLPAWAREVFPTNETTTFNRIQSKIYPKAFGSDENLLICAPTGAGKTNVAMLTMLRAISNHRFNDAINKDQFKIVYIAPLKALVSEQVREFQRRLTPVFGLVVNELTGDASLSQQQIKETNVLITTPEKWDIITRENHEYLSLIKLVIIDEIHLLHDQRGPVLESIIARINRDQENEVRIVGLSATLPNYNDVAKFIGANEEGIFYFDSSYRPCPLEQKFVVIKDQKALKKRLAIDEACYDLVHKTLKQNHQLIVFVHSRNETVSTAEYLINRLSDQESDLNLVAEDSTREILSQESAQVTNAKLQRILGSGIGAHHAGLSKEERTLVEDLFAQGHLKVLVSTATLAWGVNLPAHTVIIKGTEVYSPESGSWMQLSPQDVFQMLGRAGRPRYDKNGEGVIITTQDEIQYYLAILNQQYPIESQMLNKLIDSMNAEVVRGSIKTLESAVDWLGHTYLYVRMLQLPSLYMLGGNGNGIGKGKRDDPSLYVKRAEMAHVALTVLQRCRLIEYDNGLVKATELGKIASYHYISYQTINRYNSLLKPWHKESDIIRVFAQSDEFQLLPVRREERLEISKLMEKCPFPIREPPIEPVAKISILFQTYISRLHLEGYALIADMIYIKQSADRLLHALYELAILKKWSSLAKYTLELAKMAKQRMWLCDSPLRQFGSLVPRDIIRASESSHLPWSQYFNLTTEELAEVLYLKGGNARLAMQYISSFPKIEIVDYAVQPISDEFMRIKVEVRPEWDWIWEVHGRQEVFEVILEDCNGLRLLLHRQVFVRQSQIGENRILEFHVPLSKPLSPNLILSFVSAKWVNCTWKTAIVTDLTIPKDKSYYTARTNQLDDAHVHEFENIPPVFSQEVYDIICDEDQQNCFIGINQGQEKLHVPDLAISRHLQQSNGRAVYITSKQTSIDQYVQRFAKSNEANIFKLTGDLKIDVQGYNKSQIIVGKPEYFYSLVRRWKTLKSVRSIGLLILDDLHLMEANPVYEFLLTRVRLLRSQYSHETSLRLVAISYPLMDVRDVCTWLDIKKANIVNFPASVREHDISQIDLTIDDNSNVNGSDDGEHEYLNDVPSYIEMGKKVLIYANSNEMALKIAKQSAFNFKAGIDAQKFVDKVKSVQLKAFLKDAGVALYLNTFSDLDKKIAKHLFANGTVSVLIATRESEDFSILADVVMIDKTQYSDNYEHREIDYNVTTIFDMIGSCSSLQNDGHIYMQTSSEMVNYYSSFINTGIMVESQLRSHVHEFFIAGIVDKLLRQRAECLDLLTHSFFYRRLLSNPSYYNCKDISSDGLSEYLSMIIESVVDDLVQNGFIEEKGDESSSDDDDDDNEEEEDNLQFATLNKALIASHYGLSYDTLNFFGGLSEASKLKDILLALANAVEFENIPIRNGEDKLLTSLAKKMPIKLNGGTQVNITPFTKVFILIQAFISRVKFPDTLRFDVEKILEVLMSKLLNACIDMLSGEGHLNAMLLMDLSQMITQRTWSFENHLRQIPHFDNEALLKRCKEHNVTSVYDIMSLEDDERDEVLQIPEDDERLNDVAAFVNKYPNVKLTYDLQKTSVEVDESVLLSVSLERDEEMESLEVVSNGLPISKTENWWIVVGVPSSGQSQLYAIKKCQISQLEQTFNIEFNVPTVGEHKLTCWVICDSYLDADKEANFTISIV
ncbi:Pre-mRNA-splicing helicase BRR2 [Lodderomyces elongisporus]|uniref:Pre-mRNA-splicing helicase BRR2 n=1 Tax=Lodderomyces elongisporus TaxID=36914 RepID=UPI0029256CB0|nr:Pre-mRNA-splicing helicase BRR2 [Lodderomyces elongisporus]WLF80619.1 Pre-mRNA-splicing helicase BRR2 [Lodderomyces elongisporus]